MTDLREQETLEELRGWLADNWDPERGLVEWRSMLADSGWGMPHWPREWYGRDLPVGFTPLVDAEFDRFGALQVTRSGIRMLAAATILEHGSDLHRQKFLRRIITGEDVWCQLFSEPGSGSDLAACDDAGCHGRQQVGCERAKSLDHECAQGALGSFAGANRHGRAQTLRGCPISSSTCSQPGVDGTTPESR